MSKEPVELSPVQRRELKTILRRLDQLERERERTRLDFARLVERVGMAAVARELGVSRQAVWDRAHNVRSSKAARGAT